MLMKPKSTDYPYNYEVVLFSPSDRSISELIPATSLARAKSLVKQEYSDVEFDDDFDSAPFPNMMYAWNPTDVAGERNKYKGNDANRPLAQIERFHNEYEIAMSRWKKVQFARLKRRPGLDWTDSNLKLDDCGGNGLEKPTHLDYCEEEYNVNWDPRVDLELKANRHVQHWMHNDPILGWLEFDNGWEKLRLFPHYKVLLTHGTELLLELRPQSADASLAIAEHVDELNRFGNQGRWASDVIYDVGELPSTLEKHNRRIFGLA